MSILNQQKALYWITLSGLPTKRLNAILSVYSASEVFELLPSSEKLKEAVGDHYAELLRYRDLNFLDDSLSRLKEKNIGIITFDSPEYPEELKQREVNPPPVLYYKGNLDALKRPRVAIVGTRVCSRYGRDVAEAFARDLAMAGVTVVSGLATGIDSYAHASALEFGLTAAVLGGGFNHLPVFAQKLAENILASGGAIFTEYKYDFAPTKYSFPDRNRIISGLSSAVVVVEAAVKSGSLITADYALEQGREIFAVPGPINSAKSAGTNALIREGHATLVTCANEVLSDLRLKTQENVKNKPTVSLDFYEQKLYNLLVEGVCGFDELVSGSGFKPGEVNTALFTLEMKGLIKKLSANKYRTEEGF